MTENSTLDQNKVLFTEPPQSILLEQKPVEKKLGENHPKLFELFDYQTTQFDRQKIADSFKKQFKITRRAFSKERRRSSSLEEDMEGPEFFKSEFNRPSQLLRHRPSRRPVPRSQEPSLSRQKIKKKVGHSFEDLARLQKSLLEEEAGPKERERLRQKLGGVAKSVDTAFKVVKRLEDKLYALHDQTRGFSSEAYRVQPKVQTQGRGKKLKLPPVEKKLSKIGIEGSSRNDGREVLESPVSSPNRKQQKEDKPPLSSPRKRREREKGPTTDR